MRRSVLCALLLLGASTAAPAALLPGDAVRGKQLHAQHCVACHDSRVYTRPGRTVKTVEGLMGRVRLCDRQLNTRFERDQLNDLVKHLNDAYYRFP